MKRMIKVLLILAATVAAVAALAITAGATELKTGIGIVEASGGLRLRSQASTSSDILSTAHNGDNVVVIRQVGDWYLVNYNLKIGYMHSDYITFKERENIELGYGSVDPYLANIRSGPSTSSGLVDQAGSGAKVFIFGFNCGWYKVKYNGQIGYIRSDLVTLLEKPYDLLQQRFLEQRLELLLRHRLRRFLFLGQQLLEQHVSRPADRSLWHAVRRLSLCLRRHFSLRL